MTTKQKCECGGELGGAEYELGYKFHYDGVSEEVCLKCGKRKGRWCQQELTGYEVEPPFCNGGNHPRSIPLEQSETN